MCILFLVIFPTPWLLWKVKKGKKRKKAPLKVKTLSQFQLLHTLEQCIFHSFLLVTFQALLQINQHFQKHLEKQETIVATNPTTSIILAISLVWMKNISKVILKEAKICLKFQDRQKTSVPCFSSRINFSNIHRIYFIMNLVKHSKGWSLEEREEIQTKQLCVMWKYWEIGNVPKSHKRQI